MSTLSLASIKLLQIIHQHPECTGLEIKEQFNNNNPQTGNALKQLEQYGYITYKTDGWCLSKKGEDVLKYS